VGYSGSLKICGTMSELKEAVYDLIHIIRNEPFDFSTGVCCCGSPVEDHSGWENHEYVDAGCYSIDKAIQNILEKM
jgi:hypothetical protein